MLSQQTARTEEQHHAASSHDPPSRANIPNYHGRVNANQGPPGSIYTGFPVKLNRKSALGSAGLCWALLGTPLTAKFAGAV